MRRLLVLLWLLVGSIVSAEAQVSISIGINLPSYPTLVAVPGYPVYYAPQANANYFFYDGMYWVYQGDNWYASSWYNGPWWLVGADEVPLYVLRVPVRYYRQPPVYFRGWSADAPPHWGEQWGNAWDQRHRGWDQWDRRAAPRPAPLPLYQKQYSGSRYPRAEQQPVLQSRNYRYQPRDAVVQQHYQASQAPAALPSPVQTKRAEPPRSVSTPPDERGVGHPPPVSQAAPAAPHGGQAPREGGVQHPPAVQPPPPVAPPKQVRQPEPPPREQAARQAQPPHGEGKGQGKGEEKGQGKGEEKGQGKGEK